MTATAPSPAPAPAAASVSRLPAVSGRQDALDGVRAIAALMVLLFHVAASTGYLTGAPTPVTRLLSRGEIGVPIFFVLSGLLLYRPWASAALGLRPSPGTGGYLWRRLLRLMPAYWVVMAVAIGMYSREHLSDIPSMVGIGTLTYGFDPHPWWTDHLGPKGLGQMWSLCVEASFYVALPLLALLLDRWARRGTSVDVRARRLLYALGAMSVGSVVYALGALRTPDPPYWGSLLPQYLGWFGGGMALAVVTVWANADPSGAAARFARTVAASAATCWTACALVYVIASTPVTGLSRLNSTNAWTTGFSVVLYGLVALLLVAPAALASADDPLVRRVLGNPVLAFLGRVSYGIFLWQFVVIFVWFDLTDHAPFTGDLLTDFPVCLVLTVAVAAVSYHAVEEPVRKLGTRLASRRRARTGSASEG
ncbi:acyltransferase [Actinomadura logoneensis]|uniref:Acyltransferase n=1 Tax=Actinomadura logoneensis TaxID=2293572 RepID=A0A372JFR2_9ACTN|nr:acyltransferase [Actinomadura logoneensis]RFU38837.1 acyltransferase [Actinomadura logoneensis]